MYKRNLTANEARDLVRNGAALLDRRLGTAWRKKINLKKLDLSIPCSCIEGQLFGGLTQVQFSLLCNLVDFDENNMGFNLPRQYRRSEMSWARLTAAWIMEIRLK
jgi:hypothetical protein